MLAYRNQAGDHLQSTTASFTYVYTQVKDLCLDTGVYVCTHDLKRSMYFLLACAGMKHATVTNALRWKALG